jgi:hypothetical protein
MILRGKHVLWDYLKNTLGRKLFGSMHASVIFKTIFWIWLWCAPYFLRNGWKCCSMLLDVQLLWTDLQNSIPDMFNCPILWNKIMFTNSNSLLNFEGFFFSYSWVMWKNLNKSNHALVLQFLWYLFTQFTYQNSEKISSFHIRNQTNCWFFSHQTDLKLNIQNPWKFVE